MGCFLMSSIKLILRQLLWLVIRAIIFRSRIMFRKLWYPLPLFPAVLHRSKSTPGLVESSGKIPLESMVVSAGLPHPTSSEGSHCTSRSHTDDFGSLPENLSGAGSSGSSSRHAPQTEDSSAYKAAASADITNSMTVSSITSYISDSSAQKSPTATEHSKRSYSPPAPVSPRSQASGVHIAQPSAFTPIDNGASSMQAAAKPHSSPSHSDTLSSGGQHHTPLHHHRGHSPRPQIPHPLQQPPQAFSSPVPPMTYSAYPVTYSMHGSQLHPGDVPMGSSGPSTSPSVFSTGSRGLVPGSTPTPLLYSPGAVSPNVASSSTFGSLPRDPSNEMLLQEISRLRERLQTLESENASMNRKLNKQQWDVENRLAEIEMQVCGSDRSDCEDNSCFPENKESMI